MPIEYKINHPITVEQFIDLLHRSTLSERRPVVDQTCMQGVINNSNLLVTAWDEDQLVGIARSMTDFHYACYLSDLAVDRNYQKQGLGKTLMAHTQSKLGPLCKLILIAAPDANQYYEHLGFNHNPRAWVLEPNQKLI